MGVRIVKGSTFNIFGWIFFHVFFAFTSAHAEGRFDHVLMEGELSSMKHRAVTGDGEASLRVANHYYSENKLEDGDFWVRLSSEQGNCEGRLRYAEALAHVYKKFAEGKRVLSMDMSDKRCRKFVADNQEYIAKIMRYISEGDRGVIK